MKHRLQSPAVGIGMSGGGSAAAQPSQSNANDDTVSFLVHLPTKPEQRERMRGMLMNVLDTMAREPDFISTWVHEDMNAPDTLVLYETWACSREHFMAHHLTKPYRQAYEAALPELLSGERRIEFLTGLKAYPARLKD
jgi:quinol monooxygenase YgiN